MASTLRVSRDPMLLALLALLALIALIPDGAMAGEGIDSIMLRDPELRTPKTVGRFPEGLVPLWLKLLDRPEADFKVRAAGAIADAQRRGMAGLDKTVPNLVAELDRADQSPAVRVALVQALAVLDAKDAAAAMARAAADGDIDVRQIVDPCLTRWQYGPARATWLARIASRPSQRGTILAIRGLLAAQDERAIPRLGEIAKDNDELAPVRLEAAAALAALRRNGLEADATALAAASGSRGLVSRIVAATLLRHHEGAAATALLRTLAVDPEGAVAARAMARLVELDPGAVAPVLDAALANPDPAVRRLGVAALARNPTDSTIRRLGDRLNDLHPEIRTAARGALRTFFASPDWKDAVRRQAGRILNGNNWGGLQQAALLVGEIDHEPAVDRLLDLLDHERREVFVSAAWAMRALDVPAKTGATLAVFQRRLARIQDPKNAIVGREQQANDEQLSQLAQYLGTRKFAPASTAFRALIPKNSGPVETRAAAIWALSKIHDGQKNLGFEAILEARLNAVTPFDMEEPLVRRMCAIAIARVGATAAVPSLRNYYVGRVTHDETNNACGWALERLVGEKMPAPADDVQPHINFFALPLEK